MQKSGGEDHRTGNQRDIQQTAVKRIRPRAEHAEIDPVQGSWVIEIRTGSASGLEVSDVPGQTGIDVSGARNAFRSQGAGADVILVSPLAADVGRRAVTGTGAVFEGVFDANAPAVFVNVIVT